MRSTFFVKHFKILSLLSVSILIANCGGGKGGGTDADGNAIGLGVRVRIVSGNNQEAKRSVAFANPLVAIVESFDGDPVPFVNVTCSKTGGTDAVITGPTSFTTSFDGLISTTVTAPSNYGDVAKIECAVADTPDKAVFSLEAVPVVDYVQWVVGQEPSVTYTADDTVVMSSFQAEMYDDDGFFIPINGATNHWMDLTITTAGHPSLIGTTRQFFSTGIATWSDIAHIKSGTITIRATHNRSGEYIERTIAVSPNVTTGTLVVLPGETYDGGVSTLAEAVTGTPTAQTTDGTFNVDVYAVDDYFNTTTVGTAVSVSTPADSVDTEPAASNFVSGTVSFTIDPVQAGTSWLVRPSSIYTDNDSTTFAVDAGAAANLIAVLPGETFNPGQTSLAAAITGSANNQTAGTAFNATVYATDAEYNVRSDNPTVSVATSDPSDTEPSAAALSAGTRSFSITNTTTGVQTVTPSAGGYASIVSNNFTVVNGPATQLLITVQASGTLTAGDEIAPQLEIRDAYSNIVTSGVDATASMSLSLLSGTGTIGGSATISAIAGIVDFNGSGAFVDLIGVKSIRVTKADTTGGGGTAALTADLNSITIINGPASQFLILDPTDNIVGASSTVTVQATDAYTNVDPTYNNDVTLNVDGSAFGGGTVDIISGSGSLVVNDFTSEIVNLTLTDTFTTGLDVSSTEDVFFSPAPAVEFFIVDPTDGDTSASVNVTVQARDIYGNVNTSYNSDVTLNVDGSATGDGLVDIINGSGVLAIADTLAETVNLTLTDSQATGLAVTSTQDLLFDPGPVTRFDIVNPTDTTAGSGVLVTVNTYDFYNNFAYNSSADVTLNVDGSATGDGVVDIISGSGILTITNNVAETVNLTLTDHLASGADVTDTEDLVYAPGPAVQFVIINPTDTTAGSGSVVVVQAQDALNNVDTSYNTNVTLDVDGSATGDGVVTITNGSGTLTISNNIAETVNLSLTDHLATGLTVTSTQDLVFSPGTPTKFVILNPADSTAGSSTNVTVQAQDALNNVVTTYGTNVTLVADGSAVGDGVVTIAGGSGTLAVNDLVAETVNLSLTDHLTTGLDVTSTQDVVFAPGPATKFVILNPTDTTVNASATVTVQAQDIYNNVDTAYGTNVTLDADGSATGDGVVTIAGGSGSLAVNDLVAETVNLSLTDHLTTGLDVTSTQDVIFAPGAAVKFVILDPSDTTVNASATVTVQAQDIYNNVDTAYGTNVTLDADGSAVGDGIVTIAGGSGSLPVNDLVAETVNLSLTDHLTTGLDVTSTQDVIFAPGAAVKFVILDPTDSTVASSTNVTVQAQDTYNNVDTAYGTNVTLDADGSATGDGIVTIASGSGVLAINDLVAETVNLSLTDHLTTGLDVTSTQDVVFAPGAAVKFVIINPSDTTVNASATVIVQAQDILNNVDTAYGTNVTLNADGSAVGDGIVTIAGGSGSLAINDLVAETVNLSLTDHLTTGLDVTSTQDVVFAPAAAVKFVILNPSDTTVNASSTVTVQAQDTYNNVDTAFGTNVTLDADGSATGDGIVTIAGGSGSLPVNDLVAETVNLSLTDHLTTGLDVTSTQDVVFTAAAATKFVILDPADTTVNASSTVTVQAQDAYDNIDLTFGTNVTLDADGSATGDGIVTIAGGSGSLAVNNLVAETVNLSLTDHLTTGLDVTSTQDVVFAPAAAVKFVILNPSDTTVNASSTVTVQAQDTYNNVDTAYGTNVTLNADGSAVGDGVVTISGGSGSLPVNDLVAETVNLSLTDHLTTGLDVTSTQDLIFTAAAAVKFVILNPADSTVGASTNVTVQAQDTYNNIDLTYGTNVTLDADGSATGDGVVTIAGGSGVLAINDLVAETVNLSLTDHLTTGLDVTSTQDVIFTPGAPVKFVIVNPSDTTVNASATVFVEVQDAANNVVTTYNTDVTLNADGSASGDGVVDIINGSGSLAINDLVAETVNLSLTDHLTTGLDVTSTQDVVFAPAAAVKFVILNPSDTTVNASSTVTVQAQDAYNNIDTAYGTNVTLDADGSATGDGVVTIAGGSGSLPVNDLVAETVNLSLTDHLTTGLDVTSTQDVVFAPAAAVKFVILNPSDTTVNASSTVTVQAQDTYNNVDTAYGTNVTLNADGSATGDGVVTIAGGSGSLPVNDLVAETVNLSLTDHLTTGLDVTSTQDVIFAPAAAVKFVILNPADTTVNASTTVTVQAQDTYNNVDTAYGTNVTLNADGSAVGDGVVTISGGSGSLPVNDLVAETVNLSLTDHLTTGLDVTSTQDVVFAPAAAVKFVILNPSDTTVNASATVTVQAQDTYNNVDTAYGTNVTLDADGSAVGDGVVTISGGSGSLPVNDLVAETVNLSLTDHLTTGLDVTSTQDVIFAPAAAVKFVILDPANSTVGSSANVTVQAQDTYNNVDTAYGTNVTLNADGSATGDGVVTIAGGSGVLAINDLVAETVNLSLTDHLTTGLDVTSTQDIIFVAGTPTKFVIINPSDATVNASTTVTVQAQDAANNIVTTFSTDVTLNVDGSAVGGGVVDIINGSGSLVVNDLVAEVVNLTLTDHLTTGLDVTSTQDVIFSAATATKFVILDPSDTTVNASATVTVQALDQYNNIDTAYGTNVTLNADGSATGDGVVTIAGGSGSLPVNDLVAETVNLSLTDHLTTGLDVTSTQDVIFTAAAATKFVILNPTDTTVNASATVTVQAQDAYNNIDFTYGTNVTLDADGSATGDGVVTIAGGSGSLPVNDLVAETVNLSLTDHLTTGLDVTSTQDVVFAPAAATKFVILNPSDATVNASTTVTVQAQDAFNNIDTAYGTNVTLNADGSATGDGVVTISGGSGSLPVNNLVAETVNLSLTDHLTTGLDVTSTQDVVFTAAAATKFVILNPSDTTVNASTTVTVQAQDAYDNIDLTFATNVTLDADGSAVGDGIVTIAGGSGSLPVNDLVAETVNLSLTDHLTTGLDVTSTQDVVFTAAAATKFVILDPTDTTVNASSTVTVQAQDAYDNIDLTYGTNVTLNADGSATGDGIVTIAGGSGSLAVNNLVAETVNLSLTDHLTTGLDVTSTQDVIFAPAAAVKFVILDPANSTVGSSANVTVQAQDTYNNVDTAYGTNVTLNADGSATGDGIVTIAGGSGVLAINDLVAETVNLSLTDHLTTGLDVTSTQDVIFTAGAATKFVIINPSDATVNASTVVTVQAQDAANNIVTTYNTDVTLNADGSAVGDGVVDIINGSGTITINDLVAETVNLSLTDHLTTGLDVTSTQDVVFTAAAATKFVILNPADTTVNASTTVTVQAQDAYNNIDTAYGTNVTLNADGSATGDGVVTIAGGSGSLAVNDLVAETVNLSLTDHLTTGLDVTSTQDVVFTAAAATKFVILNPADTTVNASTTVTVQAQDAYNNIDFTYGTNVTLDADGSATGNGIVTIAGGSGSLPVNDLVAETVNLSLTDHLTTGLDVTSTQDVVFTAAAATKFVILDPADTTVNASTTVTVQAQDAYDNIDLTFATNVTLDADGSATGDGIVTIAGGSGSLAVNDLVAETVNLSLTDHLTTGLDVTSTQDVIFGPATATKFVILNPSDTTVNASAIVIVQAQDAFNNIDTAYATNVTLNADGSATGDGVVTMAGGSGTIAVNDLVAETVNLSLTDHLTTGLDVTSTQDVIFTAAAATKFVILDPADTTVNASTTVTVQAQDAYNNVDLTYGTNVTLNADGSATGDGIVTMAGGSGSLPVNDLVAETVNLSLTDHLTTGLDVTSTQDVIFTAAAATKFVILNPADTTVNASTTVTVQAQDAYNNVDAAFGTNVTLNADGSAIGDGIVTIAGGSGSLPVNDLVAETVNLSLTDHLTTGLDVTSTQDVVFTAAAATKFVILDPADTTVNASTTVTVQAQDAYDNIDLTYGTNVTLDADGSAVGDGIVTIAGGSGSLPVNDLVAETVNLSLTDHLTTGLDVTSTQDVVFTAAAATKFVILDPTDSAVGASATVTVQAQDIYNNIDLTYGTNVTLDADGSATGDGIVTIAGGSGSLSINNTIAETVNLSLTDHLTTGLDVTSTQDIIFTAGAATKFVILNPADTTVNASTTVTVQVQDAGNNIVTTYNTDVTLAVDGSAVGGGVIDIINGSGTLVVNDLVAEVVNLSLTDHLTTGLDVTSTQDVVFTAAAATKFVILDPADTTVNASTTVTVQAQDAFNNIDTAYGTNVTLNADGSAVGDGVVTIAGGSGSLPVNDLVAETVNLSLTDHLTTGLDVTSTQDVVFTAAAATKFVILNPSDTTVNASTTVTVQAQDAFNNIDTAYGTNVTLNADGSAVGDGVVTISGGSGSLPVNNLVAETVNLSLTDHLTTGLDVTSTQDVVFTAAAATKFVILNPADTTVNASSTVTVQAQDAYDNIDFTYATNVTLDADGSATGDGVVTIVGGSGSLPVNDLVAETVNLSLTDHLTTGLDVTSTQDVIFTAAAATKFVILNPSDTTVNASTTVTVQAQDAYDNIDLTYGTNVTLNADGSATGDGVVTIAGGSGSLPVNDLVAETVNLSLTDHLTTGLDVTSTQDVIFGPAVATKFVILNPSDTTVNASATVTVQAQDAFNNVDTAYATNVTLNADGSAVGDGIVTIAGGSGTIAVNDLVAETVNLSLTDHLTTGLDVTSTQDVVFTAAVATKFVILNPSDTTVNASTTVTVQAQDAYDNIDLTYGTNVTLNADGSATGDGVVTIAGGSGSLPVNDLVAETVNLSLTDHLATGLDVTSTQDVVFTAAAATKFVILNPADTTVNASTIVTVQAQDAYNNIDTAYATNVTLDADGSATGDGVVTIAGGSGSLPVNDLVAETVNLSLTDHLTTGLDVTSTQDVIFTAAAATKFVILNPSDTTVNASTTVTVQAQDAFNNIDTAYGTNVTLNADGSAVGDGVVTISGGSGSLPVNNLVAETVNLSLTDHLTTGLDVTSTQDVVFTAAAATKFVILDPADTTVNASTTVMVQALDAFNNIDTAFGTNVTLNADGSAVGDGVVTISGGSGSLPVNDLVAETVNLSLTDHLTTGLDVTSTQDVVFTAAAATKFVILDPADTTVNASATVTVQALDAFNNIDTAFGTNITLNADGSATGDGVVTIAGGSGSLAVNDLVAETVNLSLTDHLTTGLDVTSTQDVIFTAGAATKFVILDPADTTVNASTTVTVQAQDAYDNIDFSYGINVTLNADGSATGDGVVTIAGGSGSLPVNDLVAETVNLSLTDHLTTGLDVTSTQDVVFTAAAATKFVILDPADTTVNASATVTVQALDAFNNIDTAFGTNITLNADGSATGDGVVTIAGGSGSLAVNDLVAETVNLSLTDHLTTGLDVTSTQDVVFTAAAATKFVILDPADTTVNASTTVTVQAQDAYDNIDFTYGTNVTLAADGSATGDGIVTIAGGSGSLPVNNLVAETVNLTLTDHLTTGLDVSSTQDLVFSSGSATQLLVSGISDPTTAGNAETVTVTAQDTYGNTDIAYTGTVSFVSSDGTATLPADYTFVGGDAGVRSFASGVILRATGDQTVTASDTVTVSIGGTQSAITVDPASIDHFIVTGINDPTTSGTAESPVVTARDVHNNTKTDYTGTIAFNSDDASATLPVNYTFVGGDSGSRTFTSGVTMSSLGDYFVRVQDTVTTSASGIQSAITVTHGVATQIAYTLQPTTSNPGDDILVTLEIRDAANNLVSTGVDATANVSLSIQTGSGSLSGTTTIAAVGGVASFTVTEGVSIDLSGAGKVLRATKADTTGGGGTIAATIDSNSFTITTPSTPTTIALDPANSTLDNDSTPTLNVTGVSSGNTVTLYTNGTCSSASIGSVVASGASANVTVSPALSEGSYTLFATQTDPFTNESGCVSSGVTYNLDLTNPDPATALILASAINTSTASSPLFSYNASGSGDINRYEISLGTTSGASNIVSWTNNATNLSATFTGLSLTECSQTYWPSVRVVDNADNVSAVATHASGFTVDASNPAPVSSLSFSNTTANASAAPSMSWAAATDNCGISHYEIALGTSSGGEQVLSYLNIGNVTAYQVQDGVDGVSLTLAASTNYFVTVKSVDTAGRENTLSSSAWQLPDVAITDVVEPVDSTYGASGNIIFQVTWSENVNVTGTPRIQLDIGGSTRYADYSSGTGTATLEFIYTVASGETDADGITATSTIDLNSGSIQNGSAQNAALNTASFLDSLAAVLVDTSTPAPDQVTGVTLAPTDNSTTMGVTWNIPNDNGTAITHYEVQYRENGTSLWANLGTLPTVNTAEITGLSSGTDYDVRVAASNGFLGPYSATATASIFNVNDLNPIVWLDADDPNGDGTQPASGSSVATWVNKAGTGTDATEGTAANQPTYAVDAQNGRSAMRFDDHAVGLEGTYTRSVGTDLTIIAVGQFDSGVNDKAMFEFSGGGSARGFFIDRRYASNTFFTSTRDQFNVYTIQDSGTAAIVDENGVELFNGATLFNTDGTGAGSYVLGDDVTGGNRLEGYIGEFIIFDGALSATEISDLEAYLKAKWGTP